MTTRFLSASADMTASFIDSGASILCSYGKALSQYERHYRRLELTKRQQEQRRKDVREWQQKVQCFFEAEHKRATLKQFICNRNSETTTIDVRITSIVAFLLYKLMGDSEASVHISGIGFVCAQATDGNELEYRRLIMALLVDDPSLLRVISEEIDPYNPSIGLHDTFLRATLREAALISPATINDLRIATQKKGKKDSADNTPNRNIIPLYSPRIIESRLATYVVGHEEAVRSVSCRLALHLKKAEMILGGKDVSAPNEVVLMIASPSSGKSHLASSISRVLTANNKAIPFSSISAVDCTEVGFVGLDAQEVTAKNLISSAGGDVNLSRVGIGFLDEIDKRSAKSSASNSTDISSGFQYGLLKLVEGSEFILNEKRYTREAPVKWNSYGVFFLLGGAFEGLEGIIKRRLKKSGGIGFGSSASNSNNSQLLTESLVDYGICRQLLSRCTCIIRLKDPTIDELIRILDFGNGILNSYNQILSPLTVSLSSEAKITIAAYAHHNKTFARGMKRIVSRLIEQLIYSEITGNIELGAEDVMEAIESDKHDSITATSSDGTVEQADDTQDTETEPCEIYGG
jgi:ATP-dependent Clp protease ATP-binding subunit ClpX